MSVLHGSSIGAVEDALELVLDGNSNYINGQQWIAAGGRDGTKVVMVNGPTYNQLGTIGYWRFNIKMMMVKLMMLTQYLRVWIILVLDLNIRGFMILVE